MEKIVHPDHRLGKLPYRHDPRHFQLAKYIQSLPPAPVNGGYAGYVSSPSWKVMLNDRLGDCVPAYAGHEIQLVTSVAQPAPVVLSDDEILKLYEAVGGYVDGDPSTDNGCVIVDLLNYWRKTGIFGHRILAYAQVDYHNHDEVRQAINLFGSVCIGIALPIAFQNPPVGVNGLPAWVIPARGLTGDGAPGTWGGHCVPGAAYGVDKDGNSGIEVISWGAIYDLPWGSVDAYVEECWAVISVEWVEADGKSPSGFDMAQLQADLAQLT